MINEGIIQRLEVGDYDDDDVSVILLAYKQLIKDNADLHKKLSAERVFVVNDDK